jgi:hypothetical protein
MAFLLVIAAIGCGSGGGSTTADSTGSEKALTKAQFIKQADAICLDAQEKKGKLIGAWAKKSEKEGKTLKDLSEEELGQVYLKIALPPIEDASSQIADLNPPEGDTQVEKVLASLSSTVEGIEEEPTQVLKGAPFLRPDKLAQAYGFEVCGYF